MLPYIIIFLILWIQRENLIYRYLPLQTQNLILDIVLLSLFFIGLVCLIQQLKLPLYTKKKFEKAIEQTGLHNGKSEYPSLVAVRSDKYKEHGKIYKVANKGISIEDFSNALPRLQAGLNGKIYKMEYGRKTTHALLYVLPYRYVRPTVISLDTEYLSREPNFLIVGKTGSGKSYMLSVLLGIYAHFVPEVSITICDYKKSSFAQFSDTPNFYGHEDVPEGIKTFYKEFSERLTDNDEERNKKIRVLLIDEYGALISAQDKKAAEELKTMVANMLFMGRSLGIRVLIGVQRADAEHFKAGARDQFRAILGLGNLSKEQKQMLFSDYKDSITEHNGLGEGYLLIDGQGIERVRVAAIRDFDALNDSIRAAMGGAGGEAKR